MPATLPTPRTHPDAAAVLASSQQHTLRSEFTVRGTGLHTGCEVQVSILPAPADRGRYFRRRFQEGQLHDSQCESVIIPAHVDRVRHTLLSTELWQSDTLQEASVQTVEHLLSALIGFGIDNAEIVIDGPEVPLLEGSAQSWAAQILQVGWQPLAAPRPKLGLRQPVIVEQGTSYALALPIVINRDVCPNIRLSYGIDFPVPVIGRQWFSFDLPEFATAISPCRTFGSLAQIEEMRSSGLIKGGSLENALVCSQTEWLNPPLYYDNEPVRHKLLDFLGDLSLLGYLPQAHYLSYKGSHALHVALAKAMLAENAIVTH
jgi:UDP-3-O-[3-hydroxymyristoyl] N-acetylglucosamine deacetylase